MGVRGQRHTPAALFPVKTRYNCTGSWVASRAGLDGCGKSRLPPALNPGTVQSVASRYNDSATAAHRSKHGTMFNLLEPEFLHLNFSTPCR